MIQLGFQVSLAHRHTQGIRATHRKTSEAEMKQMHLSFVFSQVHLQNKFVMKTIGKGTISSLFYKI